MRRNSTHLWRGLVVTAVLALCAALVPSQAYAAPTKVTVSNAYSVGSCTFALLKVDTTTGLAKIRVTANARATSLANYFKISSTGVACWIFDDDTAGDYAYYHGFVGTKTVNQSDIAVVPFEWADSLCTTVLTTLKSGAEDVNAVCGHS